MLQWRLWILRMGMCLLLIPFESKIAAWNKGLLINSNWLLKGQRFLVWLSGRGHLGFPAEVDGWKSCTRQGYRMDLIAEVCFLFADQLGSASLNLKLLCSNQTGGSLCNESCSLHFLVSWYDFQLLLHYSLRRISWYQNPLEVGCSTC